ncbi:MAG: PTS sugar transporter subunit IIA [Bacteroidota bacterium]
MKISEILNENLVRVNFPAKTKEDVINQLIDVLSLSPSVLNKERVRAAIWERERKMSTGVGNAFAIPHGKTDSVSTIAAAFAVTEHPIEYDSLDGKPIRMIFLLVGREDMVGPHIKLLSRISRLMSKEEFRKRILNATSQHEVMNIFRETEALYLDAQ